MIVARRYFISGLVQGVGFRFFAQRAAAGHQVRGMVRNLDDGRVEVYVEGDEGSVKSFYDDLLAGPVYARVEDIEEIVHDPAGEFKAFLIER
ncbi:MAG: acylphosphatase [Acidobacteriota bacterium]|nr:acylphosphatase [Acidobacteriota bacterium]MDH3529862.1 acylphosphatase [Acidobacteriota bacterium]